VTFRGVMAAVERAGSHVNPTRIAASLVFWFVMFTVMLVAANALGLQSLANVFSELVSYIPSLIAAIVIIIVGIVLGGFVGGLIMASAGGLHGGPTLSRVGKGGVIVLAVFMALQELGVASEIVTTAFAILFGAIALAIALAFGLGNRDLAALTLEQYTERKVVIDAEYRVDIRLPGHEIGKQRAAKRHRGRHGGRNNEVGVEQRGPLHGVAVTFEPPLHARIHARAEKPDAPVALLENM